MGTIPVDRLTFTFDAGIPAEKYDEWTHHTAVLNRLPGGRKAVDVVAVETHQAPTTTWLVEAKDFRVVNPDTPPRHSNLAGLAQTVYTKAQDTLNGLADASIHATVPGEKRHAALAVASSKCRIVLHLEPHNGSHTALFPRNFSASVLQQLRQLARGIDRTPLVLNLANTAASGVPWTVA